MSSDEQLSEIITASKWKPQAAKFICLSVNLGADEDFSEK